MEKQKQFIPEQLDSYLIGGCQHSSRSDQLLQIKCSKENSPRVPLVAVKTGLYNPMQPTFRMNEIEHYQGKRVDELSRKTFPLELVTLLQNLNNPTIEPPKIIYPGYDLLPLTQCNLNQKNKDDRSSFINNREISNTWKTYLDSLPMSNTKLSTNKDFNFHNYIVKYEKKSYQPCCMKNE